MNIWFSLCDEVTRRCRTGEGGVIGWLALGVVAGAILMIVLIIKLLIPGD